MDALLALAALHNAVAIEFIQRLVGDAENPFDLLEPASQHVTTPFLPLLQSVFPRVRELTDEQLALMADPVARLLAAKGGAAEEAQLPGISSRAAVTTTTGWANVAYMALHSSNADMRAACAMRLQELRQ